MTWQGVKYCFPSDNVVGVAVSPEKVSAHLRIPLRTVELQRCNANKTQLDHVAYPYDNVDVMFASIAPGVEPEAVLARYVPDQHRLARQALAKAQCWKIDSVTSAEETCVERAPEDGRVHVISCLTQRDVGNSSCSDRSLFNGFELDIDFRPSCHRVRHEMRKTVQKYLETYRSRING